MSEMTTRLQLLFFNQDGSQSILSPKFFTDDFTSEPTTVQRWMDDFSALGVFYNQDKGIELYTEKKGARLVETKVTELF